MGNSVVELLKYEVECLAGAEAGIKFLKLLELFKYDNVNWHQLPDSVQISKINEFFRQSLSTIPHSTEISEWLENTSDIAKYANLFLTKWGNSYIRSGVFDLIDD